MPSCYTTREVCTKTFPSLNHTVGVTIKLSNTGKLSPPHSTAFQHQPLEMTYSIFSLLYSSCTLRSRKSLSRLRWSIYSHFCQMESGSVRFSKIWKSSAVLCCLSNPFMRVWLIQISQQLPCFTRKYKYRTFPLTLNQHFAPPLNRN